MLDLISIGNISADLYFSADDLTKLDNRFYLAIGGKYRSPHFEMHVGGGGANVAIGGRKNGLKTAVVGMVGNTIFRKGILQRLYSARVNTKLLLFNQKDANVSILLLTKTGERTAIAYQSSHKHVLEERHLLKNILKTRAVYFGNLPDTSVHERRVLMKELKKKGIYIFVNVGPLDCCKPKKYVNELLEYVDVLILNTHEFADLVKKPVEKINFKKDVAHLVSVMKSKLLIVTAGRNGSYGYESGKVFYQPIIKEKKIVDTTGVGDSYTAAFIASYLKHEDVRTAMKAGARYAAKNVQTLGAN